MDQKDFLKLKDLQVTKFPILSVYLSSAEKQIPHASYFLSQLHALIHQSLGSQEQKYWQKDIKKIEKYIKETLNRSDKRTLAFFTSQNNLWKVLDFEFFLPPLCIVLHTPYKKPIEEALETYQKYLVLLVDKRRARLFTVRLGKIVEHEEIFDDQVPQNVKHGDDTWDAQNKIFRHIEDHMHRHLELISGKLNEFVKNKNIYFILLGGHKQLIPKIKSHLSYPLDKMVLGEFITELNIPLNEVLLHSKKIASQINTKNKKGGD